MRRIINAITNLNPISLCTIAITVMITASSLCIIKSIEDLTDAVRETKEVEQVQQISMDELTANQQQQVMDIIANNKPEEEIVPVYFEKQEDGDMIYEFGDVSDRSYFFIIINEEQGVYDYYWPTMSEDWPLSYNSLSELQDSVICHIDQEWPNARFDVFFIR